MIFGYGVEANLIKHACSAFLTPTSEGDQIVGRNFGLGCLVCILFGLHTRFRGNGLSGFFTSVRLLFDVQTSD